MARRPLGSIHLIADLTALDDLENPRRRIQALLDAGLPSLQFRAPGRPFEERLLRAREMLDLTRRANAMFVVNGDVELALALAADGVHVPSWGPTPAEIRAHVPTGVRVGASCHDRSEIVRARGCDWAIVAPVFPTASKPGARSLGADGFAELVAAADVPCYALGGVDADHANACFDAGAAGIAAIRGLLGPGGEALIRRAGELAAELDRAE